MKAEKIIERLNVVQDELSEKDKIKILRIILDYPITPTALEEMTLEQVLKENEYRLGVSVQSQLKPKTTWRR